jgi:hypothetical protein
MTRTELGKIKSAQFGWGGYNEAMVGATFVLGGESWGVGDHWGAWGVERTEHCRWTEDDRLRQLGEVCVRLAALLKSARKDDVSRLPGTPVEATFDGNMLKSWRVLEEVL